MSRLTSSMKANRFPWWMVVGAGFIWLLLGLTTKFNLRIGEISVVSQTFKIWIWGVGVVGAVGLSFVLQAINHSENYFHYSWRPWPRFVLSGTAVGIFWFAWWVHGELANIHPTLDNWKALEFSSEREYQNWVLEFQTADTYRYELFVRAAFEYVTVVLAACVAITWITITSLQFAFRRWSRWDRR